MNRFIFWLCIVVVAICAIWWAPIIVNIVKLEITENDSEKSQRAYHEEVFRDVIRPTARWVNSFRAAQGTLPSQTELDAYVSNAFTGFHILIYTNASEEKAKWRNPGVDFELCLHAYDWNLFYQSWDDKEAKYWTD